MKHNKKRIKKITRSEYIYALWYKDTSNDEKNEEKKDRNFTDHTGFGNLVC